jgi:concanavalin A-like lectin/glucanase superfamily protein
MSYANQVAEIATRSAPMGLRIPGHAAGFTTVGSPNQKLEIASNASLQIPAASSVTLAGWFFPTVAGSYRGLVNKGGGAAGTDEYGLQIAFFGGVSQWEFFISTGAGYQVIDSGAPIALNAWTFVAGQYRPSDGFMGLQFGNAATFVSVTRTGGNVNQTTNPFDMGRGTAGTYYDGSIDAVGLWTRLLSNGSGQELDTLYNAGAGRRYNTLPAGLLTGLVSWWDLDDTGLTWIDSADGNNLTASGGVTSVVGVS